jgi:hypothetical protein
MHVKTPADTPAHVSGGAKPNRLYNSQEARALLGGISESTFRRLTGGRDGQPPRLRAVKQGAYVYVPQDAIDEYIASLPSAAEEQDCTSPSEAA